MAVLIARAHQHGATLSVPAGVLAQAWRDGRRQANLARFVASPVCDVVPLDSTAARIVGRLCGVAGTSDVVDASVVVVARQRNRHVVTSDPGDITRLDPTIAVTAVPDG